MIISELRLYDGPQKPILQPDVTSGIELTDSDDFPTTEVDSDSDWADGEVALVGGDITFIEDVDLDHGRFKVTYEPWTPVGEVTQKKDERE